MLLFDVAAVTAAAMAATKPVGLNAGSRIGLIVMGMAVALTTAMAKVAGVVMSGVLSSLHGGCWRAVLAALTAL